MPEAPALETGIYTLTPTHCGTGQAAGAVDLPIAREKHTGFPFIPATSLKGVLRDLVPPDERDNLLGPDPPGDGGSSEVLGAGRLVLTDGRLLAFPVRSLQAPFLWVTCPLVAQRWERDRRALGLERPALAAELPDEGVAVAGPRLGDGTLILEDHYFAEVTWEHPGVAELAQRWSGLLPAGEGFTRRRLRELLACVPDQSFQELVRRTTPVSARVQLSERKTSQNLWYEETLPSDCLFSVLATSRALDPEDTAGLRRALAKAPNGVVQVGGNETVGQGRCWWKAGEDGDER